MTNNWHAHAKLVPAAAALLAALAFTAPARAQEFVEPRFEGLEQQLQNLEQSQLDRLERDRQAARDQVFTPPASQMQGGQTQAGAILRRMEIDRDIDRLSLQFAQDRAREARQAEIVDQGIPFRRISPSSILVVRDPAPFGLPPAPRGKYYARLQGRFVLVDAASELVSDVLGPAPAEPRGDEPARPRPPLQTPIPEAAPPTRLPPQSMLFLAPVLGGADELLRVGQYRLACEPGGGARPDATVAAAARACPAIR